MINDNKHYRELQIMSCNDNFQKIRDKAERILLESEFEEFDLSNTDSGINWEDEIIKDFIMKTWIDAKKNLNEWEDIKDVCKDTERYEDFYDTIKIKDYKEKPDIINSEIQVSDENYAIIDFMTAFIQKEENFKNSNFPDTKYKEFLYVNLVDEWIDHSTRMGGDLLKIIDKHQRIIEFEEGWELLLNKDPEKAMTRINEQRHLLLEWRKRMPNSKRRPQHAQKILAQRNLYGQLFFQKYKEFMEKRNPRNEMIIENANENDNKLSDNTLFNNFKLAGIQRKFGIVSKIEPELKGKLMNDLFRHHLPTLYLLYKESLYNGDDEMANKISDYIKTEKESSILISHFEVAKLKNLIKKNDLTEAFKHSQVIISLECNNGKFFQQLFELFFKIIENKPKLNPETDNYYIFELYNAMSKSLIYNFDKNANKMFYKFLIVYCIFKKNNINLDNIKTQICNTPTMFFKLHLEKIELYMEEDFRKKIYSKLEKENPYFSFYVNENLNNLDKTNNSNERTSSTSKFGSNILSLNDLTKIIEKVSKEKKIISCIHTKNLIEHIYETGELKLDLLREILKNNREVRLALEEFKQKKLSKQQRLMQLLSYLEDWVKKNSNYDKIFVEDLINKNIIYLKTTEKGKIKIRSKIDRKKFWVRPFIQLKKSSNFFYLQIKVYDSLYKFKTLDFIPAFTHDINDNFIYNDINYILNTVYFNGKNTYNLIPEFQENFHLLSNNWLMIEQ